MLAPEPAKPSAARAILFLCIVGTLIGLVRVALLSPVYGILPPASPNAYVLLLRGSDDSDHLESLRMMLFALKHDPDTADTQDVVVLTDRKAPDSIRVQLQREGAILHVQSEPAPTNLAVLALGLPYRKALILDSAMFVIDSLKGVWADSTLWSTRSSGMMAIEPSADALQEVLENGGTISAMRKTLRPVESHWIGNATFSGHASLLRAECWSDDLPLELVKLCERSRGRMEGYWIRHPHLLP